MPRKEPEPLQFPKSRTFDERIRALVREEVAKALYAIGHSDEEPNIPNMTVAEFEAFIQRVLAEHEPYTPGMEYK
jgi:hypothetical protein